MLKPIQVGSQVVIFLNDNKKQIMILDPKTSSVLKAYHNNKTEISPNIIYTKKYQQILASETQKTIIQVWSSDQEKPTSKISVEAMNSFCFDDSQSFLIGGSKSGNIFIWEVPTGTLLRKFPAHSEEIIKVSIDDNMYVTSATKNSIRTWKLVNIFNSQPEVKHHKEITTKEKIIDLIDTVDKYYVLTGAFVLGFVKLTGEKSEIIEVDNGTCFTINKQGTHLYIGSSNKTIVQHRINFIKEYREITVNQEGGGVSLEKTPQKRVYPKHHDAQITSICYINSLKYVVSGSASGEIIIWSRGQLRHKKTFKPEISMLRSIDRPVVKDLHMKKKITSLNRHEVSESNPEQKIFEFIGEKPELEEDKKKEFENLVKMVSNNQYEQEIERLKERNMKLNESLSHYTRLFIEKYD